MSKSFSIRKLDEQGLARLNNEIMLLWKAINPPKVEEKKLPVSDLNLITKEGYTKFDTKFLDQQGNYTALDSIVISGVKSESDSKITSQSTLISAALSAGGGGGSSATSYAFSADTSIVTVANSQNVSQSTLISAVSSAASLSDTKAESGSTRASSVSLSANTGISNALASDGTNSSAASLADTKAESASTRASSVSLSASTGVSNALQNAAAADTKAESASTRASVADSKAVIADSKSESAVTKSDSTDVSQSTLIATADSKGESGSVRASSVSLSASTGISNALASDSTNSSAASLADTKAESASTRASTADSKAVSAETETESLNVSQSTLISNVNSKVELALEGGQYSITVVSPNGGETWGAGTEYEITWTYIDLSDDRNVKIELYKGGVFDNTIISSTSIGSGGNGSYFWTISEEQVLGTDYTVKITSL